MEHGSWLVLMVAGVFATAIGVALVSVYGLGTLPLALLALGFLCSLAALLRALRQRRP